MKKTYIYIVLAMLLGTFNSCEDFLDAGPSDLFGEEDFWRYGDNANALLTGIYHNTFRISTDGSIPFDEAMSDNAYMFWEGWLTDVKLVGNSTHDTYGTIPYNIWKNSYEVIRKSWQIEENIHRVEDMTDSEKESILGQSRFLRSFVYLKLITLYGDVPMVSKVLTLEESKAVPRTPKADVLDYIVEQLELAKKELEDKQLDKGRSTAGACQALLARVYLWNNDFEKVLSATTPLIGQYTLNTAGATPYADLFNGEAEDANEIILSRRFNHSTGGIKTGSPYNQLFFLKAMSGGDAYGGAITPTGSLVDSYPMADGRLIHEAGSTYNPTNPYKDRDPRLAQSIIYPTSQIRVILPGGQTGEVLYDPENPNTIKDQQYNAKEPSATGYVWKKYADWSDHAMVDITDCGVDAIIFRYGDVLLMHAEALAETKGAGAKAEIIDIIDQLRTRCGGGVVDRNNYNSKDDLINLVRNERRIELANEGLRYFDVIRWRIGEKEPVTDGYGMKGALYGAYMRLDGIGSTNRTVLVDGVARRYVETRFFNPSKHYLFPIPQKEIDLVNDGVLTKNPGW